MVEGGGEPFDDLLVHHLAMDKKLGIYSLGCKQACNQGLEYQGRGGEAACWLINISENITYMMSTSQHLSPVSSHSVMGSEIHRKGVQPLQFCCTGAVM